jgi:hypothetical protein
MYSNGRKKKDHYVASTHFVTASKCSLTAFYEVIICFTLPYSFCFNNNHIKVIKLITALMLHM